jgi:enoyl-CoA hydratase/carnithine racemase
MTGPVAVICWNDGENRLDLEMLAELNTTLDEIEGPEGPLAVVFTGCERFFCNGVDLDAGQGDPTVIQDIVKEFKRTLGRLLLFRAFSVGAINGHAFGAGAVLACAFDYRIMREDRGYWCVNEKELGIELDAALFATLTHRISLATATKARESSHRFTGREALGHDIVDELTSESALLPRAIDVASSSASDRDSIGVQKRGKSLTLANTLGFDG